MTERKLPNVYELGWQDAVKKYKEAISKQEPKELIYEEYPDTDMVIGWCPECRRLSHSKAGGTQVYIEELSTGKIVQNYAYCPWCGQKIDYTSDEGEEHEETY